MISSDLEEILGVSDRVGRDARTTNSPASCAVINSANKP